MTTGARGRFITLEGLDGAGKSTHLDWLADRLRAKGRDVLVTREPGGTSLGERLREILLSQPMDIETETLLMFAARWEHISRVIAPALRSGTWVLSDRFTDATYAYQGGGRGLAAEKIAVLERWVQGDLKADLTLYFDLPIAVARRRLQASLAAMDRFEREDGTFFERVRAAYLQRAASDPQRVHVIDVSGPVLDIRAKLEDIISIYC